MRASGPALGRSSAIRFKFAALMAAIAIVLLFMALKFQTLPYLISKQIEHRAAANYSRLWIDSRDQLVGAFQQGRRLTIDRWGGGSWHVDFEPAALPVWAIAPDFRRIVWVAEGELHSISEGGAAANANLDGKLPLAIGAFSDGSMGAIFPDATVTRWDGTGARIDSFHASIEKADQALAESDYVAVALARTLLLYRLQDRQWKLVQQARGPEPPFRLLLPVPGMMVELDGGTLRVGEEARNSPGAAASAASNMLDLIATGEFEGVYVLRPQRDYYRLADAPPGSVVASSDTRLAVSGPGGTSLLTLGTESRFTPAGRTLSLTSLLMLLGSALAAFGGVLLELLSRLFGQKRGLLKQAKAPTDLPDPPRELVNAVASQQCILWAGAGLGAQAGYPARQSFATMLMQAAAIESWIDAGSAQKLQSICQRGRHEEAIEELAHKLARKRANLVEFIRTTYARFALVSRTHEIVTKLAFPAAITTNYDLLLEHLREVWLHHAVTLADETTGPHFVLKLYGNLKSAAGVLVSREELTAALRSTMGRGITQILETAPVLFIGCSAEGLLADLGLLNPQPLPGQKKYAVVGVSGPSWKSQVDQLSKRYGVESLVCTEETISRALPAWLERLQVEVEKVQRGTGAPVEAA